MGLLEAGGGFRCLVWMWWRSGTSVSGRVVVEMAQPNRTGAVFGRCCRGGCGRLKAVSRCACRTKTDGSEQQHYPTRSTLPRQHHPNWNIVQLPAEEPMSLFKNDCLGIELPLIPPSSTTPVPPKPLASRPTPQVPPTTMTPRNPPQSLHNRPRPLLPPTSQARAAGLVV